MISWRERKHDVREPDLDRAAGEGGKLRALGILAASATTRCRRPDAVAAGYPQFSDTIEWYGVVAPRRRRARRSRSSTPRSCVR